MYQVTFDNKVSITVSQKEYVDKYIIHTIQGGFILLHLNLCILCRFYILNSFLNSLLTYYQQSIPFGIKTFLRTLSSYRKSRNQQFKIGLFYNQMSTNYSSKLKILACINQGYVHFQRKKKSCVIKSLSFPPPFLVIKC